MIESLSRIRTNLRRAIRGKDEAIDRLLAALIAQGHVLIEDLPGLGKTTLAKALATSVDAEFRRIQFTPDLLPTDVLGGSVYNASEGTFVFHRGPIFTHILLADEINRASPRTQSALLEAMGERQVSIEGRRYELPAMFFVVATQNPIEFQGTYPLPEAQLDRFLIRMSLGYADADTERHILYDQNTSHPLEALASVADCATVEQLQQAAQQVHVAEEVGRYIVALVRATREHEQVQVGASPRGALGLFRMGKALALAAGRDHVWPDDIQSSAVSVLAHRIVLQTKSRYAGTDPATIIQQVLASVPVPR